MAEIVFDRRHFLSLGAAVVATRGLSACGGAAPGPSTAGASTAGDDDGASATAATDSGASAATAADSASSAIGDAGVPWATGGTASMTGKASYPNPFAGAATPASCTASCQLTQGPCYDSASVEIQDISYGYAGLPTRLYFQILDDTCKPVSGAVVDVWHVSPVGKYSGDDAANENVAFCTGNDSDFTSHLYFRGKQTTDASGLVYFDTCYPGWYSSRTVHVHLTISVGGQAYVTTQLCFEDALDDAIVATQPLYDARGSRDTTNTTDKVFTASDYASYVFQTKQMPDGAMLAWKTIVLRASLSETVCSQ